LLHDAESITYHNRCNICDHKYFSSHQAPTDQPAFQSPPSSSVAIVSTNDMLKQLTSNSRTPTPTSTSYSQNLDIEDPFLEDCNIHAVGETACDDNTPIPDWFTLDI